MPRLQDPALRVAAVDFIHQEAQHGVAHKRYWASLDAQGYRFRGFEKRVESLTFRVIERTLPISLRLSLVSCVEHINACFAHEFLSQRLLADAHPQMRALMEWHFAEEIEHKRVSFDVLREIAPSYAARVIGFMLTVPLFYLLISLGAARFLAQDGLLLKRSTLRQSWRHLGPGHHMVMRTLRHLGRYLHPGFDPDWLDDRDLARSVIARCIDATPPLVVPMQRAERGASASAARET